METQKMPNSQSNLEKGKWSWRNQAHRLQTILHSYSNLDSTVGAQKQKYRSVEQDLKLKRLTHTHLINLFLIKEARIHNGVKTASSISGDGKLDSYM